jgi:acyl transferase domain-containing protein/NAD(P)-dependent dehydrogenase (short-subunit alcohol dehydrogenase family)/acyl carrier protein
LAAFWDLLSRGDCALGEVPPERLDQSLYFAEQRGILGKTYSRIGGYVPDAAINRDLCPVSSEVLETADPVHLTMLQVVAETLAEGQIDPASLRGERAGIYVGHARGSATSGDFAYAIYIEEMLRLLEETPGFQSLSGKQRREIADEIVSRVRAGRPQRVAGKWRNHEANRVAGIIAETYGLVGPYLAIDAACASSLVALSQAANAIHRGMIDLAIVGGASHSNWFSLVMFSQAQALSATGSFPFDARADGFISSDGFAAIVIKPLARALADGNRIFGVIRGIGISTDGRGKSLWAPRKEGQVAAIRRAYASGIDPASVEYVEAHGTSTQLGDATELEALAAELGTRFPAGKCVPVSSVKANIGHTRETAGLAGLVKTLLCMKHGRVPAARYLETLNPLIPWESSPFYVPREDVDWPARDASPRRAAVDAFGIGGLNAHVVIDDGADSNATVTHQATGSFPVVPPEISASTCKADSDAVAVIALGVIPPGGRTLTDFNRLVDSSADAKSDVPEERWDAARYFAPGPFQSWRSPLKRGGFIRDFQYDWKRNRVPPKQVEYADPLQFMLLDAVDQALASAGVRSSGWPRERMGVVVGTGFGGDFAVALNRALRVPDFLRTLAAVMHDVGLAGGTIEAISREFRQWFFERSVALEDETGSYTSSTLSSRITKTYDLMGGACTVDAGGASSFAALACAIDRLLLGENDVVVCAAGQRSLDVSTYEWFAAGGFLHSEAGTAGEGGKAAGENITGLIPGEAAVALVLKRLDDARRDGERVLGIIRGYGAGSDPAAHQSAFTRAIGQALSSSGISADESRWIEAAALGVPAIDRGESAALREIFAGNGRKERLAIGSVAAQFGYCHGAAGLLSLARLLHVFETGRAPPNFAAATTLSNEIAEHPVLTCPRRGESFVPKGAERPAIAGVTCTTLEPLAYHVVLEHPGEVPRLVPPPSALKPRIIRLGAASLDELQTRMERSANAAESLFPMQSLSFAESDRFRLAVVADSHETLSGKLRLAAGQMQNRSARGALEEQGIYAGQTFDRTPQVAFVFPGQGSQYEGMFRELVAEFAPAAQTIARIDEKLAACDLPSFAKLAWGDGLGTDVLSTQLAVLVGDYLAFELLSNLGVRPDVIAGHSYGEYAALVAAGCWSLETALRATVTRAQAIEKCAEASGILVSTTAPGVVAEEFCRNGEERVFVANLNSPDQTVLGGRREAVEMVARRLEEAGFTTREIPVPRPFHTPLMAPVRHELRSGLEGLELRPCRVPLLSSVSNRYTSDPRDVRENLVEQLVRPVRYVELIERLLADGAAVIVEAGPRQVLTRLNRRIIGDRHVALAAFDSPKRPGVESLLRVQAALECAGCAFFAAQGAVSHGATIVVPAPQPEAAADVLHFDATAVRREKMRLTGLKARGNENIEPNATGPVDDTGPPQPAADEPDELQAQIVDFICEQTGYPAEIVGLDADLEADLGIDSIKKAQLLGELREQYEFPPAKDLTLASFPTLRHILNFLRSCPRRGEPSVGAEAVGVPAGVPALAGEPPPARPAISSAQSELQPPADARRLKPELQRPQIQQATDRETWRRLNVHQFTGTPREFGRAHGKRESAAIRKIIGSYGEHIDGSDRVLDEIRYGLAHRREFLDQSALDEVAGIAEAAGIPEEALTAYNFGLCYEFVPGCSQFAVAKRHNRSKTLLHAVNEDWTLGLILRGKLKRLVQARFPEGGIAHVLFGTCGQLGGLNGFNASGLCLTSTLLMDRLRTGRPKPGLVHPVLVRRILERAASVDEAIDLCRASPRTGAWSVCISDSRSDVLRYLEYDGDAFRVQDEAAELVASTNHALLDEQPGDVPEHSMHRFQRLCELIRGNGRPADYSGEFARAVLADRYDGGRDRPVKHATMNTICRVDTQASIVMCPDIGKVWVAHPQNGEAAPGETNAPAFHELDMRELLVVPPSGGLAGEKPAGRSERCAELPPQSHVTTRFVMRAIPEPLVATGSANDLGGPVAILGAGALARELARQFQAGGLAASIIENSGSAEGVLAAFDSLIEGAEIPRTLVLVAERGLEIEASRGGAAFSSPDSPATLIPFQVAQHWLRAVGTGDNLSPLRLVAITSLGGDFGFQSVPHSAAGGALCGLVKALRRELPQLLAKIVDAPAEEPAKLIAAKLLEELASGNLDVEVSFARGKRRVVRIVPRPALAKLPVEQRPSGVWVVTGGARGVTAHVARELAARFGLSLHLIGSSPAPQLDRRWLVASKAELQEERRRVTEQAREAGKNPAESWREFERSLEIRRNLVAFEAAGIRPVYHSCDVADREALARALDAIRRRDGPICGVLHAAGVESAARFDRKKLPLVQATIAAKIDGAVNLFELTRGDPLSHFVAFGSVSGRFGNFGQSDYSLASDMLAKVVSQLAASRPGCRGVTFHWPAWAEAGMAMRPESRVVLESAGHRFMPLAEGCAHVLAELEAGCPEPEVLIADAGRNVEAAGSMLDAALREEFQPLQPIADESPMIEGIDFLEPGRSLIAGLRLDPARDLFLIEHQHLEIPILPVVVSLECVAESVAILAGGGYVAELRDVQVVNGFRFYRGAPASARVVVERARDGFRCELRGEFFSRDGKLTDSDRPYLRARVILADAAEVQRPEIPPPPEKWGAMQYPTPERAREEGWVVHGPAFRCLHEVAVRGNECWGRIVVPRHDILAGRRRGSGWILPAAPLDACLQACGALLVRLLGIGELPQKLDRVVMGRTPEKGERAMAYARLVEIIERHTRFDVTLVGENGELLLAIEGYRGVMPAAKNDH